ncbi:hypothetical protein WMY93_029015 [Mugilogobius chulae]|uniref:Geminin coiled-coil domain containing n=1 Tax=Mugilogobius chulae TaxID=88201 RepID=A0AAW0MW36_9GOBI
MRQIFRCVFVFDPVIVFMETLASFWSRDPCDLGQSRHEADALWVSHLSSFSPIFLKDKPLTHDSPSSVTGSSDRSGTSTVFAVSSGTAQAPSLRRDGAVPLNPDSWLWCELQSVPALNTPLRFDLMDRAVMKDSHYTDSTASSPVSCAMWTDLSPHLQRNKQLHDTLVQREEELARLQEENQKLRQFLNSSFVKDLEEKAKKLCVNVKRKRDLSSLSPPISKRVCRNLTADFCSESEPSLDLWVLKTLGLKDRDTIDTTTEQNQLYRSQTEDNTTNSNVFLSPITANMLQTPQDRMKRLKTAFLSI